MDNFPRGGYPASHLDGSDICFVDLACQQALSAKCLAAVCDELDLEEKKAYYLSEHGRICSLINRYHWSERTGWYYDFFSRGNPDERIKLGSVS